ncbi:MAG: TolC family protein [Acidobacteriaceae bacterium]|nr:TolC family protein [Acidobacteriaceae bacterium]
MTWAQGPGSPGQPGGEAAPVGQAPQTTAPAQGDPTFQGSVPQGTASGTALPLTLNDAITRGLKANLGVLTNQQASLEVRAERVRALSGLLPTVTGQLSMTEQQINLQALGFLVHLPPGAGFSIPSIVGPYSYQAALANATVPLFDFKAISNFRASREDVKASVLSVKNARDLVVQAVSNAYLQIIADAARIIATRAEIDADNAVYTNAVRRHDAGVAIGLDVLRSQVELKQRQQALVATTNQFEKDKLTLGRIIGLPVGQDFTTADPSPSVRLEAMPLPEALKQAYEHRPDYQAAKSRVLAAQFSLRASKAERYPTLTASGFYGDEGLRLLTNSHGVFQATGAISFNIFDGGRIRADIEESNAELTDRRNELANLQGQIDYEVRSALLDLKSSGDQVDVARSNMDLAGQSLRQSQDRFAAGVTNTVEVVQAQQAVADANENLISAEYQYNVAKVSLARALGLAEEGVRNYFNQRP